MMNLNSLTKVFGFDKLAVDIANNLSGGSSRENIQKVLAGMKSLKMAFRGPRNVFSLTAVSRRFFPPPRKMAYSVMPFVD